MSEAGAEVAPAPSQLFPLVPPSMHVPNTMSDDARHERQQRLDAAIAAFRSEASASGYVVEEVRLRLPVPDIDVQPRVVIAQNAIAAVAAAAAAANTVSGGGLPRLPPSKLHRALPHFPTNALPPVPRVPTRKPVSSGGTAALSDEPGGFKRTASGSVIMNTLPSPLRDAPRGQFWTTVIASSRGGPEPGRAPFMRPHGAPPPRSSSTSPMTIPDAHVQLLLHSAVSAQAPASRARIPNMTGTPRRSAGRTGTGRRREGRGAARPFKCVQCPSSFDREGHLRVHVLAVHEKQRPFVCQVCEAAFGHSSSLLRHVRTVHQTGPEAPCHFRCSACPVAFTRVAQLNRHLAAAHSAPGDMAYKNCERCDRRFPSGEALGAHVRAAHAEGC